MEYTGKRATEKRERAKSYLNGQGLTPLKDLLNKHSTLPS